MHVRKAHKLARSRLGRSYWPVIIFLLAFTALLIGVFYYYLVPAMDAAQTATPSQKRTLMAFSRLVLAIVLFVLFVMLLLTFRIRRFFFPRPAAQRTKTQYVD